MFVCLFVCRSDHKPWTPLPICLKYWIGNWVEAGECSYSWFKHLKYFKGKTSANYFELRKCVSQLMYSFLSEFKGCFVIATFFQTHRWIMTKNNPYLVPLLSPPPPLHGKGGLPPFPLFTPVVNEYIQEPSFVIFSTKTVKHFKKMASLQDVYFSPYYRNRNNKTPMTTFPPGGGGGGFKLIW